MVYIRCGSSGRAYHGDRVVQTLLGGNASGKPPSGQTIQDKAPPLRPPVKVTAKGVAAANLPFKQPPSQMGAPLVFVASTEQVFVAKPFPSSLASGSRTPTEKVSPSVAWPAPFSVTVKEEGFSAATGQDKQVIVPSMPSGTAALAVPPPATPVRSSQPADGIDHLSIPASPGCAPKLHMNVPGTFLSQKVARVTFAADVPKLPTSGQSADSTASAASAAAEVMGPAVGFRVILSQSVWDVPRSLPVQVSSSDNLSQSSSLPALTKEEKIAHARLRVAVSTCTVLANNVGGDDELTQINRNFVTQLTPNGWVCLGLNGDAMFWHDTVLNYTTYRMPDRPAGISQELLEPL